MNEKGFVLEIVMVILGIIILLVFAAFFVDFYMSITNGRAGWVWQDRNGTAVKQFLKEENGCIYFIDHLNNESKTCGSYRKEVYNQNK